MKRLIANEKLSNNITCYEDLEELFDEETLQHAIYTAIRQVLLEVDNSYIVDLMLDVDGSAETNNDILSEIDDSDVVDFISQDEEGNIGKYTLEALNIDSSDIQTDIFNISEQILFGWCNSSSYDEDMNNLLDNVLPEKWKQLRKENPEYFDNISTATIINDLLDIDDEVGDFVYLSTDVDTTTRDNAFLYLDGDIVWGEKGKSHTQTLNNYNKTKGYNVKIDNLWKRRNIADIQSESHVDAVGFGHYGNKVAIIDKGYENCKKTDIINALKKQTDKDVEKVYFDNFSGRLKRIAKCRLLKN